MKRNVVLLLMVMMSFGSGFAQAEGASGYLNNRVSTWSGSTASPQPGDPTPEAQFKPMIAGGDPCDPVSEAKKNADNANKRIEATIKPAVDASCLDKYKNMKLATNVGVPDFSSIFQQLMNQVCRAVDTQFNAATAPVNQSLYLPGGTTVNTGVFNQGDNSGPAPVTGNVGSSGPVQLPNIF